MRTSIQSHPQNLFLPFKNPNPLPKPTSKTLTKPSPSSSLIPPLRVSSQNHSNLHLDHHNHQQQHKDLLVETFHCNKILKDLIEEVSIEGSDPVGILERDGDWSKEQLWAVVVLLLEEERVEEAIQVFHSWKNKETSRIAGANYTKIIHLLCERNYMERALSTLHDMEEHCVVPSLSFYNDIIHGFARKKEFDKSRNMLSKMVEAGLLPTPETYNGLIRAYGDYKLYDQMSV